MKVLLLIHCQQARGQEIFASQLGKELLNHGDEVIVVSLYPGSFTLPFLGEIRCLDLSSARSAWNPKNWRRFYSLIKEFSPDIIQANGGDTLKFLALTARFFSLKSKLIFNNGGVMGFYLKSSFQEKLNTFFLRQMDALVSVSKFSQADLNQYSDSKIPHQVIPIAVKISEVNYSLEEELTWVHIGGFTPEKNHQGLIQLLQDGIKIGLNGNLYLIGDGPLKSKIIEEVGSKDLGERIRFLGSLNNPWDNLPGKSVLILPSLIEGMPGVIAEALCLGIPVIAYRVGGVAELEEEFPSVLGIPPNHSQAFIQAMLDVQENYGFYSKRAQQMKEKAKVYFSMSRAARNFLNLYQSL
ncbi:MAG: glycosyltransferase [Algoriphagus sp.]|uniref:glycosyltransferase n=1 Tax=Algoriphagus sp. TaxID=1872435 RepID=UPI001795980E|nr:glycosyltransferase [Algoriphagus sp.]NVJ86819.1 glycosyltransferase [Algoriphagus sp.]